MELRTLLCRCGLRGSDAELSALQNAMVRKGSRGLTYFDLKKFLASYDDPQTLTGDQAVAPEKQIAPLGTDADENGMSSTQVGRVSVPVVSQVSTLREMIYLRLAML